MFAADGERASWLATFFRLIPPPIAPARDFSQPANVVAQTGDKAS